MVKVYEAICLEDYVIEAKNGDRLELERAKEYTISQVNSDDTCVVFAQYWVRVPASLFGGVVPLGTHTQPWRPNEKV